MSVLRAVAVLGLALVIQVGLGHVWAESHRFVDVLLVPVALYGVANSQRSAMLVGCASGLLTDAWFQVGALGVNGFKRTLLGWGLGALAGRLDLNYRAGRLLAGVLVALGDGLIDPALRWMLGQRPYLAHPLELAGKALGTGLLVLAAGAMLDRARGWRRVRRLV